jgi:hypothetical protein
MTLGLAGFGGASICLQPISGWNRTVTSRDLRACIACFSRSGSVLRGAQESLCRPEHLFIQIGIVGVAIGSMLNPSTLQTMWAGRSAYPQPPCQTSLQFSTPKGYGFKVSGWAGSPTEPRLALPIWEYKR